MPMPSNESINGLLVVFGLLAAIGAATVFGLAYAFDWVMRKLRRKK
jgi:hypothetical protein